MLRIGGFTMTSKASVALVMSLGVALALSASETFAAPPTAPAASTPAPVVRPLTRAHNPHNARHVGHFRPFIGGPFSGAWNGWGSWYGPRDVDNVPVVSGDRNYNYTYKFDVPWDWVHRYPPGFFDSPAMPPSPPSPIIYTPGCPAQAVTVPGANGAQQTVSIVRC